MGAFKAKSAYSWRKKIKQQCKDAGIYREYFDDIIATLADILERRDKAKLQFDETGGSPVVPYTNKNGSTNLVKNPILKEISDCEKIALVYWKELGLTPAGLNRIDDKQMKAKKKSFDSILSEVLNG